MNPSEIWLSVEYHKFRQFHLCLFFGLIVFFGLMVWSYGQWFGLTFNYLPIHFGLMYKPEIYQTNFQFRGLAKCLKWNSNNVAITKGSSEMNSTGKNQQNLRFNLHFFISRRYTQDSNPFYYPHEKYFCGDPTPELPGWDNNSNSSDGDQAIPVHLFPKHVSELHMDQVL